MLLHIYCYIFNKYVFSVQLFIIGTLCPTIALFQY